MDSVAEGASNAAAARPAAPPDHCRNCGAHAPGHFCPNCGQETRVALPTFLTFMREAAGRYVALDGRLWRTLGALVARPGFLTREYLDGRRRRYIRPARLFLVLYLLLFAVIGILQSPGQLADEVVFVDSDQAAEEIKKATRDALREASKEAGAASAQAAGAGDAAGKAAPGPAREDDTMTFVKSDDGTTLFGLDRDLNLTLRMSGKDWVLPPELKKRYEHFKQLSSDQKAERLYAGILRYGPYAMVALLPAFALLLKLAYVGRAKRYPGRPQRYAEHLVYSAHVHAFAAIMILAWMLIPFGIVHWAITLWIVYYAMRARQVVYGGRWWAGLLRAFFIATVYVVLLSFAMLGLVVLAVMLH